MSMCMGSSTVIFLSFPKDSTECHTISGNVCGAQLSFELMRRAFHLSLLNYVSLNHYVPQYLDHYVGNLSHRVIGRNS